MPLGFLLVAVGKEKQFLWIKIYVFIQKASDGKWKVNLLNIDYETLSVNLKREGDC